MALGAGDGARRLARSVEKPSAVIALYRRGSPYLIFNVDGQESCRRIGWRHGSPYVILNLICVEQASRAGLLEKHVKGEVVDLNKIGAT